MNNDFRKRVDAAYQLLTAATISKESFESIRTLLKGIHPRIDTPLETLSHQLSDYEKLYKGELLELGLENLPQDSEEEKKRKKLLLLIIKQWNELKSEVQRVQKELSASDKNSHDKNLEHGEKIALGAKGPLGIITIAAVIITIIGAVLLKNQTNTQTQPATLGQTTIITPSQKPTVKIIIFENKEIPITEIVLRSGPDCDSPHYHALNHTSVKALDGTIIPDPGGCAFGKANEVKIIDAQAP